MTPASEFSSCGGRVFSPACFSASVDRPARHRQSRPRLSEFSCDQFLADIGFIDFDDSGQCLDLLAACFTQTLQDEPRRLLGDAKFLAQLHAADALAGREQQIHGVQPLVQRYMRALEDRAGANGEIFLALVAAVIAAGPRRDAVAEPANRTAAAVWPEAGFQVCPCGFLIWKHAEQFGGADRDFVIHCGLPVP